MTGSKLLKAGLIMLLCMHIASMTYGFFPEENSRLILEAHRLGLVMQPLSQILEEYPEMKEPYSNIHREYASGGDTIQMLVRLGKPTKEVPRSIRRDVMDLIVGE